jgi:hypothetical protein
MQHRSSPGWNAEDRREAVNLNQRLAGISQSIHFDARFVHDGFAQPHKRVCTALHESFAQPCHNDGGVSALR